MNPQEFANEFLNDLIEDFNNSTNEYYFNDAVKKDKDLKVLKSYLKNFGLYLEPITNDTYKIKFDKNLLINTMCEIVTNHTIPAKNYLINNAKNINASNEILNLISESYKNCENQIIDDIQNFN